MTTKEGEASEREEVIVVAAETVDPGDPVVGGGGLLRRWDPLPRLWALAECCLASWRRLWFHLNLEELMTG